MRNRAVLRGLVFVFCCAADAFVLGPLWTGRQLAEGQFRRGYFERFGSEVGLAMDTAIRPVTIPSFVLTDADDLALPPGMIAVAPMAPGTTYELQSASALAPYLVIGVAAPLASDSEARLGGARTLAMEGARLALVRWDPGRPWREDATRLGAVSEGCTLDANPSGATVTIADDRLEIRLGHCAIVEAVPAGGELMLAAIAGPEWTTVRRQPSWIAERRIVWPVLGAVVMKVALLWWSLGIAWAVAPAAMLGIASHEFPVPAILTSALLLVVGIVATIFRGGTIVFRRLPPGWRLQAAMAATVSTMCLVWYAAGDSSPVRPNWPPGGAGQRDACAVIGYSTVEDQGLRGETGGIRTILNESCERCRDQTASLSFGGATLGWAEDAYCRSVPSFGSNGRVTFLGGANDDLLSGVAAWARMFVIGRQGIDAWHRNAASATAASLARIDAQTSAVKNLVRCARSRGARFLFLHDFVVTDLVAGREPERASMLAQRRAAVQAAGGAFVDLLDTFHADVGVSWFNDYVHLSRIGHQRVAELACAQFQSDLSRPDPAR